jgi:addiction module RelE/StbE family toxin
MRLPVKRELLRTSAFIRAIKRYLKKHPQNADELETTLELLVEDVFDTRLKTHKLKGDLDGAWSCSAGHDVRVLFEFVSHNNAEAILLLTVGSHDEVY